MSNALNFSWHWSPIALSGIILLCVFYAFGVRRERKHHPQAAPLKLYQVMFFALAMVALAVVFLTPVDTIARTQLFSVHMAQAVVLTTICAPFFLLATPSWLLQPFLNLPVVSPVARTFTRPLLASLTFNAIFLIWHAPVLFNTALKYGTLYHVELLCFLLAALLNWWPLLGSVQELRHMSYPMQMLYAFLDGQPLDIFAFLLVFSGVVFYPHYAIPSQVNITPFGDQGVGGALLLLPGLVDLLVMSPLFFRWLAQIEERTRLNDQRLQELAETQAAKEGS